MTTRLTAKQRDRIRDLMLEVLRKQPVDDEDEIYTDSFSFADIGFELLAEHIGIEEWDRHRNELEDELRKAKSTEARK